MLRTTLLDPNTHDRNSFDCGVPALNEYLKRQANNAAKRSLSKTYVLQDDQNPEVIIGFYTLCFAEVKSPQESNLSTYPHPLPALKLARMAVSLNYKGNRFGEQLLMDVINKTARTTEAETPASVVGLFVDPKNGADGFYEKYGFGSVGGEPKNLLWLSIDQCLVLFP